MKIKNETINLMVTVRIECTEPESFANQRDFKESDVAAMKPYLIEKIREALAESWQYAAQVTKVTIS